MKLVQLNMWGGSLIRNTIAFMKAQQPDIICLQEMQNTEDEPGYITNIKEATGLEHHYFSPMMGFSRARMRYDFGNCIISRYPFERTETHFLRGQYNPDWHMRDDDYNMRNIQSVTVNTPDGRFNIVNHHGYHISANKDGNETTLALIDKICDHIAGLSGPTIFTGDLNLAPDSQSLARINTQMCNLCIDNNIITTRNFTSKRPVEVCDYIYTSSDITVKHFSVPDDVISDHQPLVLEI